MDESETPGGDEEPRYGRALLALTAAATAVAAAWGGAAVALAGGTDRGHTPMVYLLAQLSHDVGHNDWAFGSNLTGLVVWAVGYGAVALFWLGVAVWMRIDGRRRRHPAPWLRVLAAAWAAGLVAAPLSFGAVYGAEHTSGWAGPVLLHVADACSPWWAFPAALVTLALTGRDRTLMWAAAGYGAVLLLFLLVPLPGPVWVRILILAAVAGGPALLDGAPPAAGAAEGVRRTRDAAVAG